MSTKNMDKFDKNLTDRTQGRQDILEIWNTPTSTPKEKKHVIRIPVDDITVLTEKRCPDFSIGIQFRSGKYEQLSLKKELPCGDRRRHADSTVSKIRELTATLGRLGYAHAVRTKKCPGFLRPG